MYKTKLINEKPSDFRGRMLKTLRLKQNLTLKEVSKLSNISEKTLIQLEKDRLLTTLKYKYYQKLCNVYNVNHINYLKLDELKEDTIEDVIFKFKVYLGFTNNQELSLYIFNSKSTIDTMFSRRNSYPKYFEQKSIIIVETFQNLKNSQK